MKNKTKIYDYHSHSDISPDGAASMDEMVRTAVRKGLKEIAITDHAEPAFPMQELIGMSDINEYNMRLTEIAGFWNTANSPIRVVKGVELGLQVGVPDDKCREIVNAYDYDFVIGSIHSAYRIEIDREEYLGARSPYQSVIDYYEAMLECLEDYSDFDVLGHINNIDRYLDVLPPESLFMGYTESAFKKLIVMGKGIEINTSNYRRGMKRTIPTFSALKLFKELGGEIVTIGCDAHRPTDIGSHWYDGLEMLKAAGFTAITTFRKRKPIFVDI